jgi:uncharacterized protein (DUF302 family)
MHIELRIKSSLLILLATMLSGCSGSEPVAPERYRQADAMVQILEDNILREPQLLQVADIDHSRLAQEAGSPMPPAQVLIASNPTMESALIQKNQLVALDLPLRVLAFELADGSSSGIIYNNFDYLTSRYQLDPEQTIDQRAAYDRTLAAILTDIPESAVQAFADNNMQPDGIITVQSPFGLEQTIERVNTAIDAQDDTVRFGVVDFQANARVLNIDLPPTYMILFGAPGPGGKAMAKAATLGLDGFCQKFLIWEDKGGITYLSFNDLLALAERQHAPKALALRVINYRLTKVFNDALSID